MSRSIDKDGKLIDPVKAPWKTGGAFTTPPGWWHSHVNESDKDAWVLPIQDAGLFTHQVGLEPKVWHHDVCFAGPLLAVPGHECPDVCYKEPAAYLCRPMSLQSIMCCVCQYASWLVVVASDDYFSCSVCWTSSLCLLFWTPSTKWKFRALPLRERRSM